MSNSTASKVKATGSTTSRRRKKSQEVNLNNVDHPKTQEEPSLNINQGVQVIAMSPLELAETPKSEANEVSQSPLPGNRPIASSDLKLSEEISILGNRPVNASNIQVLGTISAMGERPIVASTVKVWDTISVSGDRPIAASLIKISETAMIMGNRPIASNYLDAEDDLMGYLD